MKWALIFWIAYGSGFSSGYVRDGGKAIYETKKDCMEQLELIRRNAERELQQVRILYCKPHDLHK